MNAIFGPYAEEPLIPFMENDIIPYGISDTVPGNGHKVEEFAGLPRSIAKHFRADGVGYDEVAARIADHKGLSDYDATDLVISTLREYVNEKSEGTKRGRDSLMEEHYQHELDKLEAPKRKPRPKPMTHYERAGKPLDARQTASINTIHDPMRRAAVLMMYRAGLRVSEMLSLQWRDIVQYGTGEDTVTVLRVRRSKTEKGEGREVPLEVETIKALIALLKQSNGSGPPKPTDKIIPRCRDTVYKWCRGAMGSGTHQCRHSYITDLAEKDVSVFTIMELAGHKSAKTTQGYVHTTLSTKADAVKKLGWEE